MFLTETFSPVMDSTFGDKGGVAEAADKFLQSWLTWEWKTMCRETEETLHGKS